MNEFTHNEIVRLHYGGASSAGSRKSGKRWTTPGLRWPGLPQKTSVVSKQTTSALAAFSKYVTLR